MCLLDQQECFNVMYKCYFCLIPPDVMSKKHVNEHKQHEFNYNTYIYLYLIIYSIIFLPFPKTKTGTSDWE